MLCFAVGTSLLKREQFVEGGLQKAAGGAGLCGKIKNLQLGKVVNRMSTCKAVHKDVALIHVTKAVAIGMSGVGSEQEHFRPDI